MARNDHPQADLVEPEGVNAGGPADGGTPAGDPEGAAAEAQAPDGNPEGQGQGELLSGPGSDHGLTHPGPGQEMSAAEG